VGEKKKVGVSERSGGGAGRMAERAWGRLSIRELDPRVRKTYKKGPVLRVRIKKDGKEGNVYSGLCIR
jgi:hypothetical protein